jgi:DNA-binding HxlR family transcriptional regulator
MPAQRSSSGPRPLDTPAVAGRPCSVAAALELVGDRWSLLIVRELRFGNHRFGQIVTNTGAPRDRVAARLKALVEAGVVESRPYQDSPPRSEYHLTKAGRELAPVLQSLREWGDHWAVAAPPVRIEHHDHVLRTGEVCSECGERVRDADLRWVSLVDGWERGGPVARPVQD